MILVLIHFRRPRLERTIKGNFATFQTIDPEICLISIFIKNSASSFSTTFCLRFFIKNIYHVISYLLTKFNCLVALTS